MDHSETIVFSNGFWQIGVPKQFATAHAQWANTTKGVTGKNASFINTRCVHKRGWEGVMLPEQFSIYIKFAQTICCREVDIQLVVKSRPICQCMKPSFRVMPWPAQALIQLEGAPGFGHTKIGEVPAAGLPRVLSPPSLSLVLQEVATTLVTLLQGSRQPQTESSPSQHGFKMEVTSRRVSAWNMTLWRLLQISREHHPSLWERIDSTWNEIETIAKSFIIDSTPGTPQRFPIQEPGQRLATLCIAPSLAWLRSFDLSPILPDVPS